MSDLDPSTIHGRSVAMVRHIARGDTDAANALIPPLSREEAGAQIISLVQLCARLVNAMPEGDDLLNEWAIAIAKHDPT